MYSCWAEDDDAETPSETDAAGNVDVTTSLIVKLLASDATVDDNDNDSAWMPSLEGSLVTTAIDAVWLLATMRRSKRPQGGAGQVLVVHFYPGSETTDQHWFVLRRREVTLRYTAASG